MSVEKLTSVSLPSVAEDGRSQSPTAPGLRNRASQRSFTFNETLKNSNRRRSSFISDNLSESRRSFRSSTDDLLLPRVAATTAVPADSQDETTHWHSAPLLLALLPAIAGVFFKDGSAIITDVTLLGLSGIFLNWTLRVPWEWYRAAQSQSDGAGVLSSPSTPIVEEHASEFADHDEMNAGEDGVSSPRPTSPAPDFERAANQGHSTAQNELRMHEMTALITCFLSPILGAWFLHAIRAQLSRPSEGLVSNYNLTIFLMVAELRPLSHMMKLIQHRTLYLQRKVAAASLQSNMDGEAIGVTDIRSRVEELEAFVANNAANGVASATSPVTESPDSFIAKASSQAITDTRKTMQPELDALNRAMRRYEKRMTISAVQVEARLQELELRLKDVVALAAAAQRSSDKHRRSYVATLVNWVCAVVVVPFEAILELLRLPSKFLAWLLDRLIDMLRLTTKSRIAKKNQAAVRSAASRPQPGVRKGKGAI